MMEKLQKDLPHLRYAQDPKQADIVLVYASAKSDVFAGNWGQAIGAGTTTCSSMGNTTSCMSSGGASGYSTPLYLPVRSGRGFVLVRREDGELRLVLEHSDESRMLEKSPQSKFTSRFIKEYRRQNPTLPPDRPPREPREAAPGGSADLTTSHTTQTREADVPTYVFTGEYTASISPGANFQGRLALRVYGDAVAGTLVTSSGRNASVAGVRNGQDLSLTFRFSDQCAGTAKGNAKLDGSALIGRYSATDCLGDYSGTFALLLHEQ
jgi:hypothetical protein